ncbi:helix-turn-helix domain-containing protein [Methanoculleus horonobensis]|uniref:helix-turn-helix domain-containing protein n=1 Tax=Methanoculleus horonobensis TaxID=528314 RepID=UPI000A05643F|nr:helix-turn-helix domain-containing protein [Methanoculleus horonobensis]
MNRTNELDFGRLLGVAAVAEILDVSRTTVLALVRSGQLPAAQVGQQFRIPEAGIYDYLHRAGLDAKIVYGNGETPTTARPISAGTRVGTVEHDHTTGVSVR